CMRIAECWDDELPGEASHRNVSVNQLGFDALIWRRVLVKKPPVQATLAKLDERRIGNRKVIGAELAKTVTQLAADAPGRKPPREDHKPILEFIRKQGRPVRPDEVMKELGISSMEAISTLMILHLGHWLRRLPGERYQLECGGGALGVPGFW